ncbi:MAG: hypothetical protein AAGN35_15940 [Bacteroidota bacterium]
MLKQLTFALVLVAGFLAAPARAQSLLDADNGFLHFQLGQPADSIEDIRRNGKSQRLMRYIPVNPIVAVEDIPLKSIKLFFWEGKLHSIEVKTSGTDSDRFRDWMANRYGGGKKEDAMGFRYSWEGSRIRVLFEQNLISHDALTTFVDDAVHDRYYRYMHRLRYGEQ